ncbi:MAG: hypothetical protein J5I50_12580 [Chitinophagaceae bacterium]|nr:hypothetical protein [Chitinophagaceae bacterium]
MKKVLLQLAAYRKWANKLVIERLRELPEEVITKDMGDSFGGIQNTLFHLLESDYIWWDRVHLKEIITAPSAEFKTDFKQLSAEVLRSADSWVGFIEEASENRLQHVFEYRNSKREACKQPLYEVLLHLMNHQTYHYGQIITILRLQGVDKLPATDFIRFVRSSKRG